MTRFFRTDNGPKMEKETTRLFSVCWLAQLRYGFAASALLPWSSNNQNCGFSYSTIQILTSSAVAARRCSLAKAKFALQGKNQAHSQQTQQLCSCFLCNALGVIAQHIFTSPSLLLKLFCCAPFFIHFWQSCITPAVQCHIKWPCYYHQWCSGEEKWPTLLLLQLHSDTVRQAISMDYHFLRDQMATTNL